MQSYEYTKLPERQRPAGMGTIDHDVMWLD